MEMTCHWEVEFKAQGASVAGEDEQFRVGRYGPIKRPRLSGAYNSTGEKE